MPPESPDIPDYYQVLGIGFNATQEEIKNARRDAVKRWHPDLNRNDPVAAEQIREVNEAWEILGKPESRATYNRNYFILQAAIAEAEREEHERERLRTEGQELLRRQEVARRQEEERNRRDTLRQDSAERRQRDAKAKRSKRGKTDRRRRNDERKSRKRGARQRSPRAERGPSGRGRATRERDPKPAPDKGENGLGAKEAPSNRGVAAAELVVGGLTIAIIFVVVLVVAVLGGAFN